MQCPTKHIAECWGLSEFFRVIEDHHGAICSRKPAQSRYKRLSSEELHVVYRRRITKYVINALVQLRFMRLGKPRIPMSKCYT